MYHVINYIPRRGRRPKQKILKGDLETALEWSRGFAVMQSLDIWELTDEQYASERAGHRVYGAVYDKMKELGEA